jgi:hypothetical protein
VQRFEDERMGRERFPFGWEISAGEMSRASVFAVPPPPQTIQGWDIIVCYNIVFKQVFTIVCLTGLKPWKNFFCSYICWNVVLYVHPHALILYQ